MEEAERGTVTEQEAPEEQSPTVSIAGEETPSLPEAEGPDVQAQIAAAVAEARSTWASEQEGRLQQAVAAEQARYNALVRETELARRLQEAGLDPAFAPLVKGADEGEDQERLELFQTLLRAQLSAAISARMRGMETPREPQQSPQYDRESLKGMSLREINAHWADIANAMKQQSNMRTE